MTLKLLGKMCLRFAKKKYFSGHWDAQSVQENFNLITSFIHNPADEHIPVKNYSRSVSSIPWIIPEIRVVSSEGVINLLEALNPSKALGPDELHPRVLKQLANELGTVFAHLLQQLIS